MAKIDALDRSILAELQKRENFHVELAGKSRC